MNFPILKRSFIKTPLVRLFQSIPVRKINKEVRQYYYMDNYVNEAGEVVEIVLRRGGEEAKVFQQKVTDAFKEGPELKTVEVDCADKVNLLQEVFDRDQSMRRGNNRPDPKIDHQNMEIIASFLDKCGMPTLEEVNDVQMAAIWAVIQHSSNKYRKKYLPMLENAARNGDIGWGTIAMMKDRTLLNDGEPQIYGTQIIDGELGELFEPEYVNKRRAEVGLGPIEEYLQRFDIKFDIEQKQ